MWCQTLNVQLLNSLLAIISSGVALIAYGTRLYIGPRCVCTRTPSLATVCREYSKDGLRYHICMHTSIHYSLDAELRVAHQNKFCHSSRVTCSCLSSFKTTGCMSGHLSANLVLPGPFSKEDMTATKLEKACALVRPNPPKYCDYSYNWRIMYSSVQRSPLTLCIAQH